jgi:hypothetical protein
MDKVLSGSYIYKDYVFNFSHFDGYNKTVPGLLIQKPPRVSPNYKYGATVPLPEPIHVHKTFKIEKHIMVSVSKTMLSFDFTEDYTGFFNAGIAYTNKTGVVNSSSLLFDLTLGIKTEDFRVYLKHTSNAHLVAPNYGENSIIFEVKL